MGVLQVLGKFGLPLLLGFLLGLAAIAWIAPVTLNGKLLLLMTVMVLTTLLVEALRLLLTLRRPKKEEQAKDSAAK